MCRFGGSIFDLSPDMCVVRCFDHVRVPISIVCYCDTFGYAQAIVCSGEAIYCFICSISVRRSMLGQVVIFNLSPNIPFGAGAYFL